MKKKSAPRPKKTHLQLSPWLIILILLLPILVWAVYQQINLRSKAFLQTKKVEPDQNAQFTSSIYSPAYITINNSENLQITPGFTVEAWIKPTVTNFTSNIISKYLPTVSMALTVQSLQNGDNSTVMYKFLASRKNCLGTSVEKYVTKTLSQVTSWQHVAGVIQPNGQIDIFVDGQLLRSNPYAKIDGNCPSTQPITIGAIVPAGYNIFDGIIDEVRLSNVARYSTNFTPPTSPFTNDLNTLVLYHLNGDITDASGNGRFGTIHGDIKFIPSDLFLPTPTPTPVVCTPRPACLDAKPACKPVVPKGGWCPAPKPKPTSSPRLRPTIVPPGRVQK